jgi:hypothetical protein
MWIVLVLLLLAAFVPPWINVNRYRLRVIDSISRALGRSVSVSGIEMRLLPRPGVVLSGFVVADDPSYGTEPMLRADSVEAYPRLSSLWRGRLEIGRLELDTPSLNLVRRSDGHWNIEGLLQRTSQVTAAPTSATRSETRTRFPYIEATSGRINFKLDQVKKAFSFTEADFALWQESEGEWGVRMKARPTRTDLALSDTGLLSVDGRFRRAPVLRDTPVNLKVEFARGQLGQITKLIYARDRGWRGGVAATASLSGTPTSLGVVLDAQVQDFRRYDIALGEALRLQLHCTGQYSIIGDSISDAVCDAPVNPGTLRISGNAANWGRDSYQLSLTAEQVPMSRIVAFARHAKKDLPADLDASGEAEATFDVRKPAGEYSAWSGGGQTTALVLHSNVLEKPLDIGRIEFAVPGSPAKATPNTQASRRKKTQVPAPLGFALLVKPFPLAMGASPPATVSGFFDEENYRATVSGNTELHTLVEIASALGVATPGIGLKGNAEVELELAGSWAGFALPAVSGQMRLQGAVAELQGVNEPLQVESASASFVGESVRLDALSGSFASGPAIGGTASFPMRCTSPETCIVHFNLHANELTLQRVNQLLNPRQRSQPWYQYLSLNRQHNHALLKLYADGNVAVNRLQLGTVVATNVAGQLRMNAGKIEFDVLRSELLGGRNAGRVTADFTQSPPQYTAGGGFQHFSMDQLSAAMKDSWATGQLVGKYGFTLKGTDAASLRDSVTGSLDFTWTGGSLRHVTLEGHSTPLTFSSLSGVLNAADRKLTLNDCMMNSAGAAFEVSGTAAYDRTLDVRMNRTDGTSYAISGPLEKPIVQALPSPVTQAQTQ